MSAHPEATVAAVSRNEGYSFSKPQRAEIVLIAGAGIEGDAHAGVTVKHRSRVRTDPTQPNLRQVHLIQGELFGELRAGGYHVEPGQLGENITTRGLDLLGLPRGTVLRFGPPAGDGGPAPGSAAGHGRHGTGRDEARHGTEPREGLQGMDPAEAGEVLAAAGTASLNAPTSNAVAALRAVIERSSGDGSPGGDGRPAVVITGLRNPCQQINGFRPGLLKRVLGQDGNGDVMRKAGVMAVVLHGGPIRPGDPVTVELPLPPHLPLECV
jgi:MOSC domain-containing protein YiiM